MTPTVLLEAMKAYIQEKTKDILLPVRSKRGEEAGDRPPNVFLMNLPKKEGIFERTGKSRLPIKQLMGSSMRSMVSNSVVMDQVYKEAQETFDTRIEHEIERLLAGYGGK